MFPRPGALVRAAACLAVAIVLHAMGVSAQTAPDAGRAAAEAAVKQGFELRMRQNAAGARPHFLTAIDLATKAKDQQLLQRAYEGMSEVSGDLSDWAGMLDYAQKMYDALPNPSPAVRASYFSKRGRVMQEVHEHDQAKAAYEESLKIAQANHDERRLAQLYNELGLLTWRFDRNFDKAIKYYDDGIALALRVGDYRQALATLSNSGNLFRHPGAYPEAERRYRAAMAAGKSGGIDEDAFVLKNLGIVLRETGRRDEAEQILKRSIVVADTKGQGRIQWQGRMELARFYADADPAKAAEQFEGSLASLEGLNNNVLLEGFRAGALSGAVTIYDDPYDLYVDWLLGNGHEREAFFVAERARARAFLDTLTIARAEIAAALPREFIAEEQAILERISNNQGAARVENVDARARAALQAAITADEEKLTNLRIRLANEHPSIAHARYPKIERVEDLQSTLLKPDEVLLEYFLGAKSGTLWVVTPTGLHVKRLPPRSDIESAVRSYLDALANPEAAFKDRAQALNALLLPGLDDIVTARSRLVIVPNGILNYLPFETLINPRGKFLVEERSVSYAPSSSSLAFLRARAATGTEVLAIGNPLMRGEGADTERGQPVSRIGYLKPLAFSGPEVRSVSSVYGSTARVFEQGAATEGVLSGPGASRAGIIHIATHGLIDEELPDRSGLALTAALPQSDGILQMREVYGLHLNAALVTLSACQTALGKEVTGEGMVGLSRAFFYAGANAVIASLWNVNDASTSQLMQPFYQGLAGGEGIDEALRESKIAMLSGGGRLAHPYYWAAFVVSGNGSAAVPIAAAMPWKTWGIGAAAGLLVAGGVFARRRVRY